MEYYQADVYDNVRFNTFIPNGGNIKFEGKNRIYNTNKSTQRLEQKKLLSQKQTIYEIFTDQITYCESHSK